MASQNAQPTVSGSSVAAAGLASAVAALITSRFGVAGTLIGAAITTMIITGGSAVLKGYLEGVTGRVRKVPGKVRRGAGRMKGRRAAEPEEIPARPDLRNNFVGRLRAAFDWFFRLPPLRRRAILAGAVVPAVIAFLISMGAVTALEVAIGKSLPCGIWNKCPVADDGSTIESTRPTLLGAGQKTGAGNQQVPGSQQQEVQPGVDPNVQPEADPGAQPVVPDPVDPGSETPDAVQPQEEPVEPAPADQAAPPVQETPAPADQAAPPVQETPAPSE